MLCALPRVRYIAALIVCILNYLVLNCGGLESNYSETGAELIDLSLVFCGRNDGHHGEFTTRLRQSLYSHMLGFCRRSHLVKAEIVLVEWRPPQGAERLSGMVGRWIMDEFAMRGFDCDVSTLPTVRVIIVEDEQAAQMMDDFPAKRPKMPHMLEFFCKNVGLKRGKGTWLLMTNADDMFSPKLYDFLALARHLPRDAFYRTHSLELMIGPGADTAFSTMYDLLFSQRTYDMAATHVERWALYEGVLASGTAEKLCSNQKLFLRTPGREHEFDTFWKGYDVAFGVRMNNTFAYPHPAGHALREPLNLFQDEAGGFVLATRDAWEHVRGAPLLQQKHNVDMIILCRFASLYRQIALANPCFVANQWHPSVIHDQYRSMDRDVNDLSWQIHRFRSQMQAVQRRFTTEKVKKVVSSGPLLALRKEKLRLHQKMREALHELAQLERENDLRLDNTWEICQDPWRPFPSARRFSDPNGTDWGFANMKFAEVLLASFPGSPPRARARTRTKETEQRYL